MPEESGATPDVASRIAELESRLRDVEERERGMRTVRSILRELLPPEVREHLRAARREQLLAARSFIDHWIERTDRDAGRERETIAVE